jgi:hypothetical protein
MLSLFLLLVLAELCKLKATRQLRSFYVAVLSCMADLYLNPLSHAHCICTELLSCCIRPTKWRHLYSIEQSGPLL